MDDSKKKPIMIAVVIVCLGVAGAVTFMRGGGGGTIDDIPDDQLTWVICMNPDCKAEYQMSEKAYHKAVQENLDPRSLMTPAITCEKCGKASVFKAEKCTNPDCGAVFRSGSVPNDFADRCPECDQSETEKIRERRKSGGQ